MTLCCIPVLLANLHQALPSAAPPCCCKHTRNFPEHISSLWKTISNSSGKFQGSASERRRTRVPHFPKLMWPLKLFSLLWIRNTFSHKLPPKKTFLQLHATKDRSNIKEVSATGLRDRCLCIFLLFKVNDEICFHQLWSLQNKVSIKEWERTQVGAVSPEDSPCWLLSLWMLPSSSSASSPLLSLDSRRRNRL